MENCTVVELHGTENTYVKTGVPGDYYEIVAVSNETGLIVDRAPDEYGDEEAKLALWAMFKAHNDRL